MNVLLQALAQRKTYSGADDVGFAAFAQRLARHLHQRLGAVDQPVLEYTRSTISLPPNRTKVAFYDKEYPSRAQSRGFSLHRGGALTFASPDAFLVNRRMPSHWSNY